MNDDALARVRTQQHNIEFMDFGDDEAYLVRYSILKVTMTGSSHKVKNLCSNGKYLQCKYPKSRKLTSVCDLYTVWRLFHNIRFLVQ